MRFRDLRARRGVAAQDAALHAHDVDELLEDFEFVVLARGAALHRAVAHDLRCFHSFTHQAKEV